MTAGAERTVMVAPLETYWEQRLSDVRADLVRWMFVFWAGNVVTTLGIVLALR